MTKAIISLLSLFLLLPALGEEAVEPLEEKSAEGVVWQNDPMCQFVFFAVLEGLYRDGIPNEVVDQVLGEPAERGEEGLKRCFVFRCELCHATYEAFRAYRARPAFQEAEGPSAFSAAPDMKELVDSLRSEKARSRVYAMGDLVRPWIVHRVEETRRTDEEKQAMIKEFKRYARDGAERLREYTMKKDQFYLDWNFYGSCQACEAAELFDRPSK